MDWGAFAGGLNAGLNPDPLGLKKKMTQQKQPPLAPGYEDPYQQASMAGPADFAGAQQQGGGTFGSLQDLIRRLFSQGG